MKNTSTLLFRVAILFEILWGAYAWFTWELEFSRFLQYLAYISVAIIAFRYKTVNKIKLKRNNHVLFAFLCYVLGTLFYNRFSLPSLVGTFLLLYPIWVLISDNMHVEENLSFATKGLAYILIPGLILHVLSSYIFIPGIPIAFSEVDQFFNSIFLLHRASNSFLVEGRFHSVFLEPGYMASMLSFMLLAVKYDFKKWENIVMLVALLVCLSLAGYIITFVGYTMFLLINKRSVKNVLLFTLLIIATYNIAVDYNGGKNYLNEKIFERLAYDEEKGIAGNNRTGEGTEFYYNQAIRTGDIWLGLGQERVNKINAGSATSADYSQNIRGAGYKVYLVKFGIVSALMFLLFYLQIFQSCSKKPVVRIVFLLLIILTFLTQSTPQSTAWIYPIILGLQNYNKK